MPTKNAFLTSTRETAFQVQGFCKQVKNQLTGGLTEPPDRHAASTAAPANAPAAAPPPAPAPTAADKGTVLVEGQQAPLGGAASLQAAPPAGDSKVDVQPIESKADALDELVRTSPGQSFEKGAHFSGYIVKKDGDPQLYVAYNKGHLENAYDKYYTLSKSGQLGKWHAPNQIRMLTNGDKVVAYHTDSILKLADRVSLVPLPADEAFIKKGFSTTRVRAGEIDESSAMARAIPTAVPQTPGSANRSSDPASSPFLMGNLRALSSPG